MRLRVVLYCFCIFILASCGARKKVKKSTKKKTSNVVLIEEAPSNLPNVNEKEVVKALKKENPSLNDRRLGYIKKYAPIAVQEMRVHRIPASITLAQGILESGSGVSELASKSNNHFGIKCHTQWQGGRVYHDDDEAGECFRKYQYVESSYKDHSAFLTQRSRYSFLFNYPIMDYRKWAKGLKKAGYATDKKYPNKLIKIIEDYKLYQFDSATGNSAITYSKNEEVVRPKYSTSNYYEVKKGDTLYYIARKFNTTVAIIKEINGLENNIISIGQQLRTH